MRREEIIAAIEKMRAGTSSQARLDEFVRVTKQSSSKSQTQRASLNEDFQRAFIFLIILATGLRYLKKNHWNFLRPNIRSIGLAVVMVFVFLLQLVVVGAVLRLMNLGAYGIVGFMYLLMMEFIGVVWLVTKIQPRLDVDELGMHTNCIKCKYDLAGLESVLGDELWVGPAACPECGQDYPAVGQ